MVTLTPLTSKPRASTSGTAHRAASTYTPAAHRGTLYGQGDLAVHIVSASPIGGRYSLQFFIVNEGTNVIPQGWTFTAALPLSPSYTYQSNAQQALYPGDKIAYTLGFDLNSYAQPVYQPQYAANNYYTQPAYPSNCGYAQNYTYNGVYNYPNVSYGCNNGYNYSNTVTPGTD